MPQGRRAAGAFSLGGVRLDDRTRSGWRTLFKDDNGKAHDRTQYHPVPITVNTSLLADLLQLDRPTAVPPDFSNLAS